MVTLEFRVVVVVVAYNCFKRVLCSVVLVMCWPGLAAGYRPDIGNIATAVTPRTPPREHARQHHAHLHAVVRWPPQSAVIGGCDTLVQIW